MVRYFKKFDPTIQPVLSNNTKLAFTTLNGLVGYFATDSEWVQNELVRLINEQRFGVTEISAAEFTADYVEKKSSAEPLKAPWREEVSGRRLTASGPIHQLGAEAVAAVVGGESGRRGDDSAGSGVAVTENPRKPVPVAVDDAANAIPNMAEPEQKEYKAPVGKRIPKANVKIADKL